jgi:hypothetical protein
MSYNSIYRRDLFRDHIVVITAGEWYRALHRP